MGLRLHYRTSRVSNNDEKSFPGLPTSQARGQSQDSNPLKSSDSQPWLHVRVTWGAFGKTVLGLYPRLTGSGTPGITFFENSPGDYNQQ